MYENNLLALRLKNKETQKDVADMLGMNVTVYARYERGERDIPLSIAKQISKYYDASIDYIACNHHEVDIQEIAEAYKKGLK